MGQRGPELPNFNLLNQWSIEPMNIPFVPLCTFVVITTLLVSVFLAPILWDAAGYIEQLLNNIYTLEGVR